MFHCCITVDYCILKCVLIVFNLVCLRVAVVVYCVLNGLNCFKLYLLVKGLGCWDLTFKMSGLGFRI